MFRDRIQEKYEELSPRFRSLADFILENTLDVGFLTATELARRVGVDPATVVRFSQELGYSGYRELSREIKRYINRQLALRYQQGSPDTTGLASEIALLVDELSDRVLSIKADVEQIAQVAEHIRKARRVFVTSTDESYGLAELWSVYLTLVGIPIHSVKVSAASAAMLLRESHPDDMLIAISLGLDPGGALGNLLKAAAEIGVFTVSVTTSPTLLPARQADINLVAPSRIPAGYPAFDTLVSLLSLIWQALIILDRDRAKEKIQAAMNSLNKLMEQQGRVPPYDVAALHRLWSTG